MKTLPGGIFPTMLVTYGHDGAIDYDAMGELLEWYIARGVHGIFALCHSTEIHRLSLDERLSLASFVVKRVAGRVCVVMSGMTANTLDGQLAEARLFARLKPDALVFISNRLEGNGASLTDNLRRVTDALPDDLPLGIYECPEPYKRVITDDELRFLADSGRFAFIKDTCCDVAVMRRRQAIAAKSRFRLYNANCASLLETLRFGYSGFSGIMANFHPELYVWLYEHQNDSRADRLSDYLGVTSLIEARCYPVCAKQYLRRYEGLSLSDACRSVCDTNPATVESELREIHNLTEVARSLVGISPLAGTMPVVSLDARTDLMTEVDKEPDVYLGHPTTVMLADGMTVFAVYPKCHGFGQLVLKKSIDGGKTWSPRLPVPDSFSTSMECPTIYRLTDRTGVSRLFIFTGTYPFRMAISEDDGAHFSEFRKIGDYGGFFISTIIETAPGAYTAFFHDESGYIHGGHDVRTDVYRAGTGTDMRTRRFTYRSYDGGVTFESMPRPYWKHIEAEHPGDRFVKIYETMTGNPSSDGRYALYCIKTTDGGLTWSAPRTILESAHMKICEPCALFDPSGKQIAVLLRENARRYNSLVILSDDGGETWSAPREMADALTGDRHAARYLPDGRLFVTFRDMKKGSPYFGSWVGWVGSYEDLVSGKSGDCRVLIKRSYGGFDCAYPGLELLGDGTLLATTYGRWQNSGLQSILSVRIPKEEYLTFGRD